MSGEILVPDAVEKLAVDHVEPFDLVFTDAEKENNPVYLEGR